MLVGIGGCLSFSQSCIFVVDCTWRSQFLVVLTAHGVFQFPLLILCGLQVSHPLPAWVTRSGPLGDRDAALPLSISFRFPLGFLPSGGLSSLASSHVNLNRYSIYPARTFSSPCQVTMLLFLYAKLKVENEVDGERNPYFGKEL